MSVLDPSRKLPVRRVPWLPLLLAASIITGVGLFLFWRSQEGRKVAQGESTTAIQQAVVKLAVGKVGDLQVTEEAMKLAEIKIGPASERLVAEKLPVSGSIEAGGDRIAKITSRVSGKVITVGAVVGDAVSAGQTLALIESTELAQAQAAYRQALSRLRVARDNLNRQRKLAQLGAFGQPRLEEARRAEIAARGEVNTGENEATATAAELAEARSEVGALRAALSQAETGVRVMASRFERANLLFKEELISRQDWEQTQADHERAKADVDAARANLAQGEAKVDTAEARLRAARAKVAEAKKRFELAAKTLRREQAVLRGGYASSKELMEAEAGVRQATLDQEAAAEAVRLLGGRPGGGSVVKLTTPIAGRVQERAVSLGQTVDSEHALFTVMNLDQVWAQLAVTPKDFPLVRTGQPVELTAETAPGRVFRGTVSAIGNTADEKTRTVSVRCVLQNARGALRPETFVRGHIITDVREERVVVPPDAIQEHDGTPTVYVAQAGHLGAFEVRHVKLGVRGENWREIREGLKGTEQVATGGTFYLKSEALKSALSDGCCAVPGE